MSKLALAVLIVGLGLTGCATTIDKIDVPGIESSTASTIKDARPDSEKEREILSYIISSDAYGINREGEARLDPSPMRLFQHRVYEKLGAKSATTPVTVHHLVIYRNQAAILKRGVFGGLAGPIGALIATATDNNTVLDGSTRLVDRNAFEALSKNEHQRAYYAAAENPNNAPAVIIYIDADIGGKRTLTRTFRAYDPSNSEVGRAGQVLDKAIKDFLSLY